MVDVLTKKQRSYNMSRIHCKNTSPEMIVRSIVHRLGYRYSLHRSDLPGKPDLVLVKHKKIIFVHGCYWHRHNCRFGRVMPSTRRKFWQRKLDGNRGRDKKNISALKKLGWKVLVVWECQLKNQKKITNKIIHFLED